LASTTTENYLKAIYNVEHNLGYANTTLIAGELQVSLPTVNSMFKKLGDAGLINYKKYKNISLTAKGKKTAALIIRKHRLTEMFLTEKMGFGWEEVHVIAEQIEHIQSQRFFDRIDEILGFPMVDPHGSPIPDKQGKMKKLNLMPLNKAVVGTKYMLKSVTDTSAEFLSYLNVKGMGLGLTLKITKKEDYDGSITIAMNKNYTVVSEKIAQKLLVEPIITL